MRGLRLRSSDRARQCDTGHHESGGHGLQNLHFFLPLDRPRVVRPGFTSPRVSGESHGILARL